MAMDSLKQKGLNVYLKVLDTKNKLEEIKKIQNQEDFSNYDAVIGPLVYKRFKEFATNFNMDSIPLISPISKKNHALIFKSNVVQNTPKLEDIENKMLQYIRENYKNQNIVIVADEGKEITPRLQRIQQFLKQNDSIKKIAVLQMKKNQIKREEFDKVVLKDKENWFILVTNPKKPTTTSVVVNTLGAYPLDYKIILFALEKSKNFKDAVLSNKDLNRLNVHFPLETFIDTENSKVKAFTNKYIAKFGSLPTIYSFKGFDTTYDTAIRLANYNKMDTLYSAGNSYRMADKYKYQKVPYQGYYNKGVYIVEMKDFQLMKANENEEESIPEKEISIKAEKKE
jgi:ABC-type branched-subunit amino acid transport system substrate-binding protein